MQRPLRVFAIKPTNCRNVRGFRRMRKPGCVRAAARKYAGGPSTPGALIRNWIGCREHGGWKASHAMFAL
jgi:hypothetical protein